MPTSETRSVLDEAAAEVLRRLDGTPQANCRTVAAANGLYCFVAVGPAAGAFAERVPGPKRPRDGGQSVQLERDILALLAGRRMATKEVRAALEAEKKEYGESTVVKCLASMRRRGILDNDRAAGGYSIRGGVQPNQRGLFDEVPPPPKPRRGRSRKESAA